MSTRNLASMICLALIVTIVCAELTLTTTPSLTQPALAAAPPRPTLEPAAKPGCRPGPTGGSIELHVQFPQTTRAFGWQDLWTTVQWQDGRGNWHDVEGWRGTLDYIADGVGVKTWWVAKAQLGAGPFRWQVTLGKGGEPIVTSLPFDLPDAVDQTVTVEVSLGP
jgi:hypothetical protein